MRSTLTLLVLVLSAAALHAQPARDLFDAQQAARAHERDLAPALALSRETAGVLRFYLTVERTLGNDELPSGSRIDRALSQMDDFERDLQKRNAILPTDIRRRLSVARKMLEDSRVLMPADLPLFRDHWHHDIVHPAAARVAEEAAQINMLINAYTAIENNIRQLQTTQLAVLSRAESVPGLPGEGIKP
jgi:hypothetical protein